MQNDDDDNAAKRRARFICAATQVHGTRYDYSDVVYGNNKTKVVIRCGDHAFTMRPDSHVLDRRGCPVCKFPNETKVAERFARFVSAARTVHGDRYDYSNSNYIDNKTPITVRCGDHTFNIRPDNHIHNKRGCHVCNGTSNRAVPIDTTEFINAAIVIHRDKYDYTKSKYVNAKTRLIIECPTHGEFSQTPDGHLSQRQGCPLCGGSSRKDRDAFVEQASLLHGDKYGYDLVEYVNAHTKITISCPKHGDFAQLPANHLAGNGCPSCSTIISRSSYEHALEAFLVENGIACVVSDRTMIAPQELDIFLPNHGVAIEINGLYFHSTQFKEPRYHYNKWKACHDQGIRLLHVFEDEWLLRSNVVKSKLLHLCGRSTKGAGGRNLAVMKIENGEAAIFCEKHHIQGKAQGVIVAYGAYQETTLVGAMTFGLQRGTNKIELTRFCSGGGTHPGMFSKLFKHAVAEQHFEEVISFADRRYSDGGLYKTVGFRHDGDTAIDYQYVVDGRRLSKRAFTKQKLASKLKVDVTTEREAMNSLGFPRIYDCGKMRFVWKRPPQ